MPDFAPGRRIIPRALPHLNQRGLHMLTWIIAPGLIAFGFVAAIAATLIARRRADRAGAVASMYERSLRLEKAAAHRAEAAHHRAS